MLTELKAKLGKIDVTTLTPEDFKGNKSIIERYFKVDNRYLDRIHIPQLDASQYLIEIRLYGKERISEANRKFETATLYYKKKMSIERLARDLDIPSKKLDISSYSWNEDIYMYHRLWDGIEYAENKFLEENTERPSSYENYIKLDAHQSAVDEELFNELYDFCIKAVRDRKAMLLIKISKCIGLLNSIIESSHGFSMNISGVQLKAMQNYRQFFEEYLADTETIEFLNTYSDIDIYANDELTKLTYIDTYTSIIRSITGFTMSEDSEEYAKEKEYLISLIHNDKCPLEDLIVDKVLQECPVVNGYVEELSEDEE